MKLLRPKDVCELLSIHPNTLRKWVKEGKIKPVYTPKGTPRYRLEDVMRLIGEVRRTVVGYARVSSRTQKDDLERQVEVIKKYAKEKGYGDIEVLTDIGSGLNEDRRNFNKLLDMIISKKVSVIVVAYKDRLTRFGYKMLEKLASGYGVRIEVVNGEEPKDFHQELVEDLITIISHFAGKLYGKRSHKYKKVVDGARKLIKDC